MKLFSPCMQCQVDNGRPNFAAFTLSPIPDDGVVETGCDAGHKTFIAIQQDRFELLSLHAVAAIADGYHREGVVSFAASLERLYEYYVRAVMMVRGVRSPAIANFWRQANLSERQFGAFCLAHLLETEQPPTVLDATRIKFRNDVVHNGKFPTKEEAIAFGQAAADVADPLLAHLRSARFHDVIGLMTQERLKAGYAAADAAEVRASTLSIGTPFSLVITPSAKVDVAAAVQAYAERPDIEEAVTQGAALERAIRAAQVGKPG